MQAGREMLTDAALIQVLNGLQQSCKLRGQCRTLCDSSAGSQAGT